VVAALGSEQQISPLGSFVDTKYLKAIVYLDAKLNSKMNENAKVIGEVHSLVVVERVE
jgi:hypothetical protein